MPSFDAVLTDIFKRNIERRFETVEAEQKAIALAKNGDSQAFIDLMYAYTFALRRACHTFRGTSAADAEEMRALAIEGLLEAIHAFDPEVHDRLASIANQRIARKVSGDLCHSVALSVPQRTLSRFFSILRKAGGDPYLAAELAPENDMSVESFYSVLAAVRASTIEEERDDENYGSATSRLDTAMPIGFDACAAGDTVLVNAALGILEDDLEAHVILMSYGFEDYEPVPDAEVAHRMGLSRQKVQRLRSSALCRMREALGVA
jgi:DNA-directed RNA polymerase specialized sigma subunit